MSQLRTSAQGSGSSQAGTQLSSQYRRTSYRDGDRSRRSWSDQEEVSLINALKDLVARGWKSDNGFRSGYMNMIEDWLRRDFPRCDLRASPHIYSKLNAWKKSYNLLSSILDRSGVGFNLHGDFKIDIDDDQWAQILMCDNNAKGMRAKSWPFWDDWKYVLGKDRATGITSEGLSDAMKENAAAENTAAADNIADLESNGDYHVTFDDDFLGADFVLPTPTRGSSVPTETSAQSEKETPMPKKKKNSHKRKGDDEGDGLLDLLRNLHAETNARLEKLASRIGYEMDLGKARQDIIRHLENMSWLTEEQQYDLCNFIGKENSRLEIFIGLPDYKKPGYVKRILEKEMPM